MPIFEQFFKKTTLAGIREFFLGAGILLEPTFERDKPKAEIIDAIKQVLSLLDKTALQKIRVDLERIYLMSDRVGQNVLGKVVNYHEEFITRDSAFDRSIWLYFRLPKEFAEAEKLRRNDKFRLGQYCCRYRLPNEKNIQLTSSTLDLFKEGLKEIFPLHPTIIVEPIQSFLTDKNKHFMTIYFENMPITINKIVGDTVVQDSCRKVSEFNLSYCPASGILEIYTYRNEYSNVIAKLFSIIFLKKPLLNNAIDDTRFDLMPLASKKSLDWEYHDGITHVEVEMLRLQDISQGGSVTLESKPMNDTSLHDFSEIHFAGLDDLINGGFKPTHAKINFYLEPSSKRKYSFLPITLAAPDRCDLYRRTSQERMLGEKYLKRWGILSSNATL